MCAVEAPGDPSSRDQPLWSSPGPAMCSVATVVDGSPGDEEAAGRRALAEARRLLTEGRYADALLHLRVVEFAFPRLADRVALERGEVLLAAGDADAACGAFARAVETPDSTTRAQARVGAVRCLIRGHARTAERELDRLLRRYPALPEAVTLRLELGEARELAGNTRDAIRIYTWIDLNHPGASAAERARTRLAALADRGAHVPPLSTEQKVERAERLVQSGPPAAARAAVRDLESAPMPRELAARVALMGARLARVEGRWDDARRYMAAARRGGVSEEEAGELAAQATEVAQVATARERDRAEAQIRQLKGRSPWHRVPQGRLFQIVETAARVGLVPELDAALDALGKQRRLLPQIAFEAAIVSSGVASDEHVAALLRSIRDNSRYGVAASYHYARTLERLGRFDEATAEHQRVVDRDRGTRYYALWSDLRLRTMRRGESSAASLPEGRQQNDGEPVVLASLSVVDATEPAATERREGTVPAREPGEGVRSPQLPDGKALADRLEAHAARHAEAFPWLPRVVDLLRLGELEAASDELHEAYLAWREARGNPLRRAGLEAVYCGESRPRSFVDFRTRRERKKLDARARNAMADVAQSLGDWGTALGLTGWARLDQLPRAHAEVVERAARRHGLDPNLLFAVMRVESVYQPRVVSYAGAVGLMQIMPRTGRLIASYRGERDFTTADLLDPETNIDFAAWYLASLIERFDGRLPLAIASYNGGPHNVRRWIREHSEQMPLDAFLERIPFEQTHRYVRRVLTNYAAYRAQEGLPMEVLGTRLPQPEADEIGF